MSLISRLYPILTLYFLAGCGGKSSVPPQVNQDSHIIYVSIAPLAQLATQIAGDQFEVRSIVQPGDDPHSFSPSAKQLVEISESRALFTVGMPFLENLHDYLDGTAPGLNVVDLQDGIDLAAYEGEHHDHHHHDHGHHHSDGDADIHTWLSPDLLKQQVDQISRTFQELLPDHAKAFADRSAEIQIQIDLVDLKLQSQLEPLKGKAIYVHHPAFGYFVNHYGMKQESVEFGGRAPSAKRVSELIAQAKEDNVRVIFTQPQFDPSSAEKIANAIGGAVVAVDPLAPDVLTNLETIGNAVEQSFN